MPFGLAISGFLASRLSIGPLLTGAGVLILTLLGLTTRLPSESRDQSNAGYQSA